MAKSWENMLSNPIEGEEYDGQVNALEQVPEMLCGDHLVPDCRCLSDYKRERGK